ncbi:phage tail assembly chaperone family protein, TAC [Pseudomonas tolaasii]
MSLNLKDLVAQGAFVSAQAPFVKREISYEGVDGEVKADVHVRIASYHTITESWKAAEASQDHLAARIATMICDELGNPVLSAEDVLGTADPSRGAISDSLFLALLNVINEVQSEKKNPRKTSGSK